MKEKLIRFYVNHGRALVPVLIGAVALAADVGLCELYQYLALNVWA